MKLNNFLVFISLLFLLSGCFSSPMHSPGGPLLNYLMPFLPIVLAIGVVVIIYEKFEISSRKSNFCILSLQN